MKIAAAALAALLVSACATQEAAAPAADPIADPNVRLYAMDCGRFEWNDVDMFADDGSYAGQPASMVVPCYLIRHRDGDLIWDTGLPEALADMPGGRLEMGELGVLTMPRKLTGQLAELGLTPGDIEYLSVSHAHTDHIGNGGLFAGATWIVDPDERAHAFRDEARADDQFASYAALENARTRLIEEPTLDVFGDGSVIIIQTPGHTPGHTVLLVTLAGAGPVLLSGDLYHLAASRPNRRVPRFNYNREQTLESMELFDRIAAERGARVILQHVPEDFEALPRFPEPLR